MKLCLNKPFNDLDGNPMPETHMGKLLAQTLVGTPQGQVVKHYHWALKLHAGETLELDKADTDYLKRTIEGSNLMNILPKYQLTQAIDESEKTPCAGTCQSGSPS